MSEITTHLEWHNHAYIDENNKVINVAVFKETDHDGEILENVRQMLGAKQTICCCTFGLGGVGDTWTGTEFQSPQPYPSWIWDSTNKIWSAPVAKPTDGNGYTWDEPSKTWIEIPSSS